MSGRTEATSSAAEPGWVRSQTRHRARPLPSTGGVRLTATTSASRGSARRTCVPIRPVVPVTSTRAPFTRVRTGATRYSGDAAISRSPAHPLDRARRTKRREVIGRCIESVLSQDFADLELVICDNASDDGTSSGREVRPHGPANRAQRQRRQHRLSPEHEPGARSARGAFFRWISADDWLEPGCLTACVRALERHPKAVGVTTWFTIHTADGATRYEEYRGEFPTSRDQPGASNACCGSSTRGREVRPDLRRLPARRR